MVFFSLVLPKIAAHWLFSAYRRSYGFFPIHRPWRPNPYSSVSSCSLEGRENHTLLCDFHGSLLRSPSLFPYFMLVAFEGGSLLRALILLLSSPFMCLLGHNSGIAIKVMTFITFCGLGTKDMELVARAVLPKHYLDELPLESYEALASMGRRVVVTTMPRVLVERFLKEYLGVTMVVGAELQVVANGSYFTGLISISGVELMQKLLRDTRADVGLVGLSNPSDTLFIPHCKEIYVVSKEGGRVGHGGSSMLPRRRYPKPLIFHDGRLAFLPTPLTTLSLFLWLPFGSLLSVIRIAAGLLLPFEASYIIAAATGLRLRFGGTHHPPNLNPNNKQYVPNPNPKQKKVFPNPTPKKKEKGISNPNPKWQEGDANPNPKRKKWNPNPSPNPNPKRQEGDPNPNPSHRRQEGDPNPNPNPKRKEWHPNPSPAPTPNPNPKRKEWHPNPSPAPIPNPNPKSKKVDPNPNPNPKMKEGDPNPNPNPKMKEGNPNPNPNPKKGVLYVCTHRTLLDPVMLSSAVRKAVPAVTYSVSRLSELLAPMKTVRLTRDRERDAATMRQLLTEGDLAVCPEGTTCREPYLLRFSSLFAELAEEMVPVAMEARPGALYGTTASGRKWLDPLVFLANPTPEYRVELLPPVGREVTCAAGRAAADVANNVQRMLGEALGFECTGLTRKDKYMVLAGNEGVVGIGVSQRRQT